MTKLLIEQQVEEFVQDLALPPPTTLTFASEGAGASAWWDVGGGLFLDVTFLRSGAIFWNYGDVFVRGDCNTSGHVPVITDLDEPTRRGIYNFVKSLAHS